MHSSTAALCEYTGLSRAVFTSTNYVTTASVGPFMFPSVDVFHFCSEHINEHTTNNGTLSNHTQINSYCCFQVVIKNLYMSASHKKAYRGHVYTHTDTTENTNHIIQS